MPSKPYDQVESEFIKKKISEGDFDDEEFRSYVDALVYLEEKVLNGASGYCDGMRFSHTRKKLNEEYRLIYRELKPEKYREKLVRETVQAIENSLEPEEYQTDEIIERLEKRTEWQSVASN